MKVSLNVTNYSWSPQPTALFGGLGDVARAADGLPLDTLWVSDHLLQSDPGAGPGQTEMLEAYTTLGYLAAITSRIRLGTMVTAVPYRPTPLLLKAVTTLDVLSDGRAWLGVGVGYPGEAALLGLPMPTTSVRFEQLESLLRLCGRVGLAGGGAVRAGGAMADATSGSDVVWSPAPVNGRVPVLIGGAGERRTLRLVATYADACNLFDIPDGGQTLRRKLAVLDEHCDRVGRDPGSVERTVSTRMHPDESSEAIADRLAVLHGYGLDHAVVITPGPWRPETVDVLGAAAHLVRDL